MDFESFSALDEAVTKEDWERTPASVRRLLRFMLEDFERRVAELEEDKILSSLETEQARAGRVEADAANAWTEKPSRCSFCGKSSAEVARIVSGPAVSICNECVDICNEILTEPVVKE